MGVTVAAVAMLAPARAEADWSTHWLAGTSVHVYVPGSESPIGEGRSLMVVLHGCAQGATIMRLAGNFELAAETFGMVIALPNVPNGGVFGGCWNYYGSWHTRSNRHNGAVIALTQTLRDAASLQIDPNQIYIGGISSGAGQALVAACLAPELYAGVVSVAGASVGTSLAEVLVPWVTDDKAATTCTALAGPWASHFESQMAISVASEYDFVVSQAYAELNARVFARLFGTTLEDMFATQIDLSWFEGAKPRGEGTLYGDGYGDRIALLNSQGVAHAWPAGSGKLLPPWTSISGTGVNLAYFAAEFFAANNRRVDNWGEVVTSP